MLEGAYTHIFGTLNEDIIINEAANGGRVGILSVSITHHLENGFIEASKRTDFFRVFIWSKTILYEHWQSLKKGNKVYIFGELRAIEQTITWHGIPCNAIIIEVNNRFKAEVLR